MLNIPHKVKEGNKQMDKLQSVILKHLSNHVTHVLGLGSDFIITEFNSRKMAITLTNGSYEIKVTVSGEVREQLTLDINNELEQLKDKEEN